MMQRHREPELMDDPALDPQRHVQALEGLARINAWSASAWIVWPPIQAFAREASARSLRVLDIATGAGDVPIALWRHARRARFSLTIDGCDRSPVALGHARTRAQQARADVQFFELDALAGEIPSGYDIILSSLFLHHLSEEEAVHLVRHMARAAGALVLVNDLLRSVCGFALAYLGTRCLSSSEIVHTDGPRSVRAAYRLEEVRAIARQAGVERATVSHRWPCRFLLSWRRT